jgi:mRNA interferase HigB
MSEDPGGPRKNHIISWRKIREFLRRHPEDPSASEALGRWYDAAEKGVFHSFSDVRRLFPHADQVGKLVVFNVGGNKYRVVVRFYYQNRVILLKHVLTHREYDAGKWKV